MELLTWSLHGSTIYFYHFQNHVQKIKSQKAGLIHIQTHIPNT